MFKALLHILKILNGQKRGLGRGQGRSRYPYILRGQGRSRYPYILRGQGRSRYPYILRGQGRSRYPYIFTFFCIFASFSVYATSFDLNQNLSSLYKIPPPKLLAKSYLLIDSTTSAVLAAHEVKLKVDPASLTKMMTMYVVEKALQQQRLKLDDKVKVSLAASKTIGSKMFLRAGEVVTVEQLIHGIIIQSGNDACVAIAEHIAGTEEEFAALMNNYAQQLGMRDTNFVRSTGLTDPNHYTTAYDLAILAKRLIEDFPQSYHLYKEKSYTHNKITQLNRNRLLWVNQTVDGIKTGHNEEAGYCMVASAQQNGMRLIAVIMGTATEEARTLASNQLLNFGFNHFYTKQLFTPKQTVQQVPIWFGNNKTVSLGFSHPVYWTIPKYAQQTSNLKIDVNLPQYIKAPVAAESMITQANIFAYGQKRDGLKLIALQEIPKGKWWTRIKHKGQLWFLNTIKKFKKSN